MKLQACIGPQMSIMHIRDAEKTKCMNGDLVLCGSTAAFKDYRGKLRGNLLCSKCMKKAQEISIDQPQVEVGPHDTIFSVFAKMIGVEEIF